MTRNALRHLLNRAALIFLWLFVFSVPMTQISEIAAIGTIGKVLGFVAIGAGAVAVVLRGKIRLLEPAHIAMAGFIVWSAVTLCWSIAPALTVQRITSYLQLFTLVLLFWELCSEEKAILRILQAFVIGTILPALYILKAFVPGDDTFTKRAAAGLSFEGLAFLLALSLPVSYYLILRDKSPVSAIYRLQMGIAVCAILMGGTAAIMIAMAVGLSLFCWTFHVLPVSTRARAFATASVIVGATVLFIPSAILSHISEESRNGGLTFTQAIHTGMQTVQATPVGGLGAGSLTAAGLTKTSFTLFTETGVVGVLCFVAILGFLALSAESLSGATKSFWFTILGVWTIGSCTLSWECSQSGWLLLGLLIAHAGCLKHEGVTPQEQAQKRNYYVEQTAEVWS